MPKVQHSGNARQKSETGILSDINHAVMDPVDDPNTLLLSQAEWLRIQGNTHLSIDGEDERVVSYETERKALRDKSKAMIENWEDTPLGLHKKKMEAKKLKKQQEEEKKEKLDEEEATYQAQQRKEKIAEARKLQFYQIDRVRRLHGALLLVEVLKERDAQMVLKNQMDREEREQEEEYWADIMEKKQSVKEKQKQEQIEKLKKEKVAAAYQLQQVQEQEEQMLLQKMEEKKEADESRRRLEKFNREEERLVLQAHVDKMKLLEANKRNLKNKEILKKYQKQREEEEEDEIRIFAAAKKKMAHLQQEYEIELHQQKAKHREVMAEKLAQQMKEKIDNEEECIKKAAEEQDAQQKQKLREYKEQQCKMKKEIQEQRKLQIEYLEKKAEMEQKMLHVELHRRKLADAAFQQLQAAKQQDMLHKEEELRKYQLFQHEEKNKKLFQERLKEKEYHDAMMHKLRDDEKEFQKYAGEVISHAEAKGWTTYPLKKASKPGIGGGSGPVFSGKAGVRPSYPVSDVSGVQLPGYQKESTEYVKNVINGKSPTKSKMGFVW